MISRGWSSRSQLSCLKYLMLPSRQTSVRPSLSSAVALMSCHLSQADYIAIVWSCSEDHECGCYYHQYLRGSGGLWCTSWTSQATDHTCTRTLCIIFFLTTTKEQRPSTSQVLQCCYGGHAQTTISEWEKATAAGKGQEVCISLSLSLSLPLPSQYTIIDYTSCHCVLHRHYIKKYGLNVDLWHHSHWHWSYYRWWFQYSIMPCTQSCYFWHLALHESVHGFNWWQTTHGNNKTIIYIIHSVINIMV